MIRNSCSIKKQYSLIFIFLLMGSILFISLFNLLALRRLYQYHKEKTLLEAYEGIKEAAAKGNLDSDEFDNIIRMYSSVYNIRILILDADNQTIRSIDRNARPMANKLLEYIFKGTEDVSTIYDKNGVRIQLSQDERDKLEYLELWGYIDSSNFTLMRCSIQSISDATRFSNNVLFGIGLICSIIGFWVIWLVTNTLTKPIMKLMFISEKMTQLDFSEKYVSDSSGNEIDMLGSYINDLSDKLEKTIQELKEANIELQKDIDKKTEIDEMRKDFIANVSHELKTPIALIQGYAEGLKDGVNDDAESREFYYDVIIDEANRMNTLVRNLLDLNELEFGNNNVDFDHFDIVELIHNVTSAFDLYIKNENINLKLPAKKSKIFVWADEFKVEHILNNYISNAVHYVKEPKIIDISIKEYNNIVRVSVFNSGEPIPDDVLPNIWTKFYKGDKARTRSYGGSGIGLSLVKACMEAMKHEYGVINHDNGVEFWFEMDGNIL